VKVFHRVLYVRLQYLGKSHYRYTLAFYFNSDIEICVVLVFTVFNIQQYYYRL